MNGWALCTIIDSCFLSPQPHSPDNRALARECKDVKIDRVYIGSCTGGKTEDFMAAAKLFLASVRDTYVPLVVSKISQPPFSLSQIGWKFFT